MLLDIPAEAGEHGVTGGGEAGDVGHLAAGDEGEAGGGGEVEDVFEPGAGDLFDDGGGGAYGVERGVLVPGGGEPIDGESGRERASVDPAKEASAGDLVEAAVDCGDEVFDDLWGFDAGVGEGYGEARAKGVQSCAGGYGDDVFRGEVVEGVGEDGLECGLQGGVLRRHDGMILVAVVRTIRFVTEKYHPGG
jgi:hypothetical protein